MTDFAIGSGQTARPMIARTPAWIHMAAEGALFAALLYVIWVLTPDLTALSGGGAASVGLRQQAAALSGTSIVNQLFWVGLAGVAGLTIAMAPRRFLRALPSLIPIGLLVGLALASAAWALDPAIALRRAIQFAITVAVFGFGVLYARHPIRVLQILFLALGLSLLLNLMALPFPGAYHQGGNVDGNFKGFAPHKNQLASLGVIALFVGAAAWRARAILLEKALWGFYMAGWTIILVLAQSKTSLGLVVAVPLIVFGISLLARLFSTSWPVAFLFAGGLAASIVLFVFFGLGISVSDLSQAVWGDSTFTGRTYIWTFALYSVPGHELLGYGYNSFWAIGLDSPALKARPEFIRELNDSHSGYLDLMLQLGWAGLTVFAVFLISMVRSFGWLHGYRPQIMILAWLVLIFMLIHNTMETSFLFGLNPLWMIMILMAFWPESIRQFLIDQERIVRARQALAQEADHER